MSYIEDSKVMKLNNEILDLWSKINTDKDYFNEVSLTEKTIKTINEIKEITPYFYSPKYKENCILFVSTNYSKGGYKWENHFTLDDSTIQSLIEEHDKAIYTIPSKLCAQVIPKEAINRENICHIDMFWMRHKSENAIKPLLIKVPDPKHKKAEPKAIELTDFAIYQRDAFIKMVELIKPKIMVGISAFVSDIVMQLINKKADDVQPFYLDCIIGNHSCPIILGGMVFSGHMDRWSQARLKATIQAVLDEKGIF